MFWQRLVCRSLSRTQDVFKSKSLTFLTMLKKKNKKFQTSNFVTFKVLKYKCTDSIICYKCTEINFFKKKVSK